jgi:hypothetical protein
MVNKVIIYIDMISYVTKGINFALRNIPSNSIPSRITIPYSQYEQTSYSIPTNPLLFLLFPILRRPREYIGFMSYCVTLCAMQMQDAKNVAPPSEKRRVDYYKQNFN